MSTNTRITYLETNLVFFCDVKASSSPIPRLKGALGGGDETKCSFIKDKSSGIIKFLGDPQTYQVLWQELWIANCYRRAYFSYVTYLGVLGTRN